MTNSNDNTVFHEARDSKMDKQLPPRTLWQKYWIHILSGTAFLIFLTYVLISVSGGIKLRIDSEKIVVSDVQEAHFLDYVDAEGIVQPILTIKLNTLEAGMVQAVVAEEGSMMKKGDTILVLQNPQLEQTIEEQQDEWEKQRILYQEKKLEMEQKTILLKQQTMQAEYELSRLQKDYALGEEKFKMGIKSKAQLDVQREEYDYKTRNTALQLEGLRHDSAATRLRRELMENDLELVRKRTANTADRRNNLIVRAPLDGQLSYLNVTLGQRVGQSENIGEIKVMDNFKIHTRLSEYYIDRLHVKLAASERKQRVKKAMDRMAITHRKKHFPQQLSGGQQQRVAIARAVVANPKLILADEPTGNLDSRNCEEVMNLLTDLNREGTTIVMVTHSQHDAGFADRIINLFDGKVVPKIRL